VATAGADYNQQRAAITAAAAIASIVAAAAMTAAAAVAAVAMKGADYNQQRGKDSMYTVRVPHIQIGTNLAQIKMMRLVNVQTFGSLCLASKYSSICSTD
jgi:hypothetical protein